MAVNIGQIIKEVADNLGYSQASLAAKVHTSQQNISDIYKRNTIDTDLLLKLCQELKYDFFQKFYEDFPLLDFKNNEIAKWQSKIDSMNEQFKQQKEFLNANNQIIKGLEKVIQNQEEVIRLLKEKEKELFLCKKK